MRTLERMRGKREVLGLQLAFAALVLVVYLASGLRPAPALIGILLLTLFSARSTSRHLGVHLVPLAVIGLSYYSLGGLSQARDPGQLNITNLIEWERSLFGGRIPASVVQGHLFGQIYTPILDIVCNLLYFSHFLVPVFLAVLIWRHKPNFYWLFLLGFLVLSYAGFATYLLFPAAPPWWAQSRGYLDESIDLSHFLLSTESMLSTPNPVAAMPSLHCALPLYVALVAIRLWGSRAVSVLLLPVSVGFSVVYLGHHYVIDNLAGYAYGLGAFALFHLLARRELD